MFRLHEGIQQIGPLRMNAPVFGDRKIAEALVSWSAKNKPGTKFTKRLTWGLILEAEAGSPIKVRAFIDEKTLLRFLNGCGALSAFQLQAHSFIAFGPALEGQPEPLPAEQTPIGFALRTHRADGTLHDEELGVFNPKSDSAIVKHLGTITIDEEGFSFFTPDEMEAPSRPSSALPPRFAKPARNTLEQENHEPHMTIAMSPEEVSAAEATWKASARL